MAQSVVINGVTYSDVPQVEIPLSDSTGNATFYDTSGDDVARSDVRSGVKYHGASGGTTGNATDYTSGADSGTISTVAGSVTIASGFHDGNGSVSIAAAEQAKIVSGSIKAGVTILGVQGASNVVDTTIASGGAGAAQILNGYYGYVNGSLIQGSMTAATVSQDSSTKVLSIS